jgi:hypothetical protein
MSSPIDRFLDRVRACESRQQREVVMTLMEARDLHADITRLLLKLQETSDTQSQVISVELKAQDF